MRLHTRVRQHGKAQPPYLYPPFAAEILRAQNGKCMQTVYFPICRSARETRLKEPKAKRHSRPMSTRHLTISELEQNKSKRNGTKYMRANAKQAKDFSIFPLSLPHPLEHVPFLISWGHSRLLDSEFDAPFSLRYDSLFRASSGLPGPLRSSRSVASLGKPSSEQNRNGSDKKSHTTSRRTPEIKSFPSSDSDGVELDFPRRFPTFSVDRLLTFNLTLDIRCSRYIFCKSTLNKFI